MDEQEDHRAECVLNGSAGCEVDDVRLGLHVDAERVVLSDMVPGPNVQYDDAGHHERQQVVQLKEWIERWITAEIGLTTNGYDEAAVKLAMIEASAEVAAVATSDKVGAAGSYVIGPSRLVTTLVAQLGADEKGLSRIEQEGTRVVRFMC